MGNFKEYLDEKKDGDFKLPSKFSDQIDLLNKNFKKLGSLIFKTNSYEKR